MKKDVHCRIVEAAVALACGFVATPVAGQPPPPPSPVRIAPTILISSTRGMTGALDPLLDPTPFFAFPNETEEATLTFRGMRFSGTVDLTVTCCLNPATKQPAAVAGVTASTDSSEVDVSTTASVQARVFAITNGAPTLGTFLVRVSARDRRGLVSATVDLTLLVLPAIPFDSARPACPGLNPAGSPPAAGPEVLPLRTAIFSLVRAKFRNFAQTTFNIGARTTDNKNAWNLTLSKATGVTPSLLPTEALIVLNNTRTWDKSMITIDSRNCNAAGQSVTVLPGATGTLRISSANTTSVLLRRRVCRFWLFFCWDSGGSEDVALFSESNFWTLVGGRRLGIEWFKSFQSSLEQ